MEDEIKGQDIQEIETPPAEQETVESLKSRLTEYEAKLAEKEERLAQTEKGLQTARKTASEKAREAKEAKELRSLISSINSRLDAHEEILKYKDEDDDDSDKKRTSLDKRLAEIKSKSTQEQYNALADEAQAIAQSINLDIRSAPELKVVRNYFKSGNIDLAREAITMLEEMKESKVEEPKPEPKKEEPKEAEEDRINRLVAEKFNAYLKEKGLLTPEGGVPAGSSSDEQIRKNYRENPNDLKAYNDYQEYLKRRRGF